MGKRRGKAADRSIERLRGEIDALDHRLLELLNARLECAREIGVHKASTGSPIFVAPREKGVLVRLLAANHGPFPDDALLRIYREIFSASRRAERPLTAAFAGLPGSLGHATAAAVFGNATELSAAPGSRATLDEVASGGVDYGVLPALDAPEGVGTHALLHLLDFDLHLVAEYFLPLDVGLALLPRRKAVKRVFVPPPFRELAAERLPRLAPGARLEAAASIAEAAEACRHRSGDAALIPGFTARHAGLRILRPVLGTGEGLRVRYLVVGARAASPTGADKTTLAFGLINQTGNLVRALRPFSRRRINLDLLTTSPATLGATEDLFFLDFEGHVEADHIQETLAEMRKVCSFVRPLGSYPVFDLRVAPV